MVAFESMVQPVDAVGDEVHRIARFAQALPEVVTRFGFVFNDQNFHVHSPDRECACLEARRLKHDIFVI